MPLLSRASTEQNNLKLGSANMRTQTALSVDDQPENALSIVAFSQKSSVKVVSFNRPSAVLSLSGTVGDNGWYTSNVDASLSITGDDSDSLTVEYTFYNQEWRTYSEPFTIFEEGQTSIYYRVRNSTGFAWETTVSTVDIDKTPPYGSISIEEGTNEAFSTLINLTLSVADEPSGPTTPPPPGYYWGVPSGPSVMRFSNDGILWSNWESIASRKSWTLKTGSGSKTVYVQVRDNAGLVSEPFSDTINLVTTGDSVSPVTKILVNGKRDPSGIYTSAVAITLSATDDLSGVSFTEYSFDRQTWTEYKAPIPLYTEGETTIYCRSRDANGNLESTNSQTIEIRKTAESNTFLTYVLVGIIAFVAATVFAIFIVRRKRHTQSCKLAEETEARKTGIEEQTREQISKGKNTSIRRSFTRFKLLVSSQAQEYRFCRIQSVLSLFIDH